MKEKRGQDCFCFSFLPFPPSRFSASSPPSFQLTCASLDGGSFTLSLDAGASVAMSCGLRWMALRGGKTVSAWVGLSEETKERGG